MSNMNIEGNIILDWLSFTLPYDMDWLNVLERAFEVDKLLPTGTGIFGYTESALFGSGGRVLWSPARREMGFHVILSADSLAATGFNAMGLLNRILDWGAHIARIDIALDDIDGLLDIDEMYRKLKAGELVTRFRKIKRIVSGTVGSASENGQTVQFGARQSQALVRIYDKAAEQISKNLPLPEGVGTWVRVEMELKGRKADVFSRVLAKTAWEAGVTPGKLCSGLLLGLLDFKDVSEGDDNKSRWDTCSWWAKFVLTTEKLHLSLAKPQKTMEKTRAWIKNQVAVSLAMIVVANDDDAGMSGYDFIMDCVREGSEKISKEQQKRIDTWNAENERQKKNIEI